MCIFTKSHVFLTYHGESDYYISSHGEITIKSVNLSDPSPRDHFFSHPLPASHTAILIDTTGDSFRPVELLLQHWPCIKSLCRCSFFYTFISFDQYAGPVNMSFSAWSYLLDHISQIVRAVKFHWNGGSLGYSFVGTYISALCMRMPVLVAFPLFMLLL